MGERVTDREITSALTTIILREFFQQCSFILGTHFELILTIPTPPHPLLYLYPLIDLLNSLVPVQKDISKVSAPIQFPMGWLR